jgi:antitoxin (DNA-binding transcriptional repressor) of toxin-antitoxin stability system
MKASVVDLRYRMKDVLLALERNERVTVTYRGKVKGVIVPKGEKPGKAKMRMQQHPFFGMNSDDPRPVQEVMNELRRPRYDTGGGQ